MKPMRHTTVTLLCALALMLQCGGAPSPHDARPNVILLLADDMGYADPSVFGGEAVHTPALDALAASGIRLTSFYAASAVCSPSRAAILTGRYPLRFDIRRHLTDNEDHLPALAVTLPELLRAAGYQTGHAGKWHLGGLHLKHLPDRANSVPGPRQHGFDHYQSQNEEQPLRGKMGLERTLYRDGGTCLIRDEAQVTPDDPYYSKHFTDINGDYAVELIERFHGEGMPFFLNVWFLVPHTPYEPAPEPHWTATAAAGISDDQRRFRSMVAHMDAKIGGIVAKLEELGIRDNTLIFFTSDNGGAWEADIGPYKGGKTDLHEGGIRVPAILSWPARVAAGQAVDTFGHHTDLLPTLAEAAGVEVRDEVAVDGASLFGHLVDGAPEPERGTVFWQMDLYRNLQRHYPKPEPYSTEIARRGDWKLLAYDGEPRELFDLSADPLEKKNLIEERPEIVEELGAELKAFLAAPRDTSGFVGR
jgi:N-acetylgalactosamine-6-sulfatase